MNLRHYYDLYCLLGLEDVRQFIGTGEYQRHKQKRFRWGNKDIKANEVFLPTCPEVRKPLCEAI